MSFFAGLRGSFKTLKCIVNLQGGNKLLFPELI